MLPIARIRKELFGISQAEMARIAGTTQPTISRWEDGELQPDLHELTLIRAEALRRGLAWSDSAIFPARRRAIA